MLIDTHCHLNFPDFKGDLGQVIKNSLKAGVEKIICVSSNLADSKRAIEIAKQYPGIVYASPGIHPQETCLPAGRPIQNPDAISVQLDQLDKLVQTSRSTIVAIGECGLDFSPAPPPEKDRTIDEQKELFIGQIKLAQKYNLPLIIHSRKSFNDVIAIIHNLSAAIQLHGVFHCYTGGKSGIEKINQLGFYSDKKKRAQRFYFGLDGNLTYDEGLQNVVKLLPLDKIILETDSPFLSPVPYRGQRNEPKNVTLVSECLAKLKDLNLEETAKITTNNAERLFNLK